MTLWSDNGQLRYRAPKDALTREDVERLKASRNQIVAMLESAAAVRAAAPLLEPRRCFDRAPLTFSQLMHWRLFRLDTRPGCRLVASAIRLQGRLDVDALRDSVNALVRRHDALRTQIVVIDGVPTQVIAEFSNTGLVVEDLTALEKSARESEGRRLIEHYMFEPIDLAFDPLFAARLIRLGDDEHILVLAMEHMISDGFSRNILLRDLMALYGQATRGELLRLPPVPIQFADYAAWQGGAARSWIEGNASYWNERLADCGRVRFPADSDAQTTSGATWGIVPLRIGKELKAELLEWSRLRRTTLVMSVFTAYAALVLRWCKQSNAVILFQTDGRLDARLENTIGYLAFRLFVRAELGENDSFLDLLKRLTAEYCLAHEHADYSCLEAQARRPEFAQNTIFNWLAQDPKNEHFGFEAADEDIKCSRVPFEHRVLQDVGIDTEPAMGLLETENEITGWLQFPSNRFSYPTMERFAREFLLSIRALLTQPDAPIRTAVLP